MLNFQGARVPSKHKRQDFFSLPEILRKKAQHLGEEYLLLPQKNSRNPSVVRRIWLWQENPPVPPLRCWRESGMNKEGFLPLLKSLQKLGKNWRCVPPENAGKKPGRNKQGFLALKRPAKPWHEKGRFDAVNSRYVSRISSRFYWGILRNSLMRKKLANQRQPACDWVLESVFQSSSVETIKWDWPVLLC